jgi:crotonobetainyl-CoA:carnitine CoA-transferase CaiB-like acyl-CoA transferase
MALLSGLRVAQLGGGLAAAVCGRLLADAGAEVACIDADESTPLAVHLNAGKAQAARDAMPRADLIVCEGGPRALRSRGCDPETLRSANPDAALVLISPYGQTGPKSDDPASDLTLFFASGIARMLTGQVDDPDEPPIRAVGEQSAFIGGIAAACAGMHAVMAAEPGAVIDVSIEEALATLAITELARAGTSGRSWSRQRIADGNGATVCILPARDGFAAISPRDDHQWAAWLGVMGSPEWGRDRRFATKPDRVANWDALYALMCDWSRQYDKQQIADMAQEARVPSFPLRETAEQLASPQLAHRGFWREIEIGGRPVKAPGSPFGLALASKTPSPSPGAERVGVRSGIPEGRPRPTSPSQRSAPGLSLSLLKGGEGNSSALPLSGIRVLDFSWVIAGPTATRYLAAMGAEVIKIEAPGRGDPGRASELHTVLGQAKRGVVLDLKKPEAIDAARRLAAQCDVLVENFATGVMDRLGLGADALRETNPALIYVSASGLGRTGPEARAVAYGTLLQCYAGFAGLNRHPDIAPRVGMAWLDPMCGLMLAFVTAAALWRRAGSGDVARIDFSMLEAMLWTMAEPLLEAQLGREPQPRGNRSDRHAPHGVYRCAGSDGWISIAATEDAQWRRLCAALPDLAPLAGLGARDRIARRREINDALAAWARPRAGADAAAGLLRVGVPAAPLAAARDRVGSPHLRARGFWEPYRGGLLPGLPWRSSFGRATGPAPGLGADSEAVLREVADLCPDDIAALRQSGAFG